MLVTSAKYTNNETDQKNLATKNIEAIIDGETFFVPMNPANRHYAAILEWVADGNTIQDAD